MAAELDLNDAKPVGRRQLRLEFALFFGVAPLLVALFLPPTLMFPALFAITFIGVILLQATGSFRWRSLITNLGVNWWLMVAIAVATFLIGLWVMLTTRPQSIGFLIRENPQIMLAIAVFYPFLSALPQEVVYRVLFFERYQSILLTNRIALVVINAAVFSWAHIIYWSWIVFGMTFAGGLVFAWLYRERRSFAEAVVAHSLAGIVVFALGLGVYFYSGAVQRPF